MNYYSDPNYSPIIRTLGRFPTCPLPAISDLSYFGRLPTYDSPVINDNINNISIFFYPKQGISIP